MIDPEELLPLAQYILSHSMATKGGHRIWQGMTASAQPVMPHGAARFRFVRDIVFEMDEDPVPAGVMARPICGVASCVSPSHIELQEVPGYLEDVLEVIGRQPMELVRFRPRLAGEVSRRK